MATVTFEKAQRWYPGADEPAVPGDDLQIEDGEFMVLVVERHGLAPRARLIAAASAGVAPEVKPLR